MLDVLEAKITCQSMAARIHFLGCEQLEADDLVTTPTEKSKSLLDTVTLEDGSDYTYDYRSVLLLPRKSMVG